MKSFLELAKERYSVRKFKDIPIEQEKLDAILEAGRLAPTAVNYQPQKIYVIKSEEGLKKIREITPCAFNAPVVLMVAYDKNIVYHNRFEELETSGDQDTTIVGTHMMMEAWDLGIGSCWVNRFPPTATRNAFDIPANERLVFIMPLGYPADDAEPHTMHFASRALSEMVKEL